LTGGIVNFAKSHKLLIVIRKIALQQRDDVNFVNFACMMAR